MNRCHAAAAARDCLHGAPMIRDTTRMPLPRIAAPVLAFTLALVPAASATAVEAPYDRQLIRLAEVLGSLHFLRNLCGEQGNQWRDQMEALIAAEKLADDRRRRVVAGFNHGYRSFEGIYGTCTQSAIAAIDRYLKEGETLTREVTTRYGN